MAGDESPVWNIVGERVALGPLRKDLVPHYHRWRNDFWVQRSYGGSLEGKTFEAMEAWYEREANTSESIWFTIYERESGRPIGLTDFFNLERDHGLAWWGMMIGEADCRGKGYGSETTRLMLDYGFTALNLHVVLLTVDEFNIAAYRAYKRAGFVESGRVRGATFLAGRRYDRIVMDCIAPEFESTTMRSLLDPSLE
ncbi:MAG: GNAT family N-acetyltransferase [Thermomicrobiales bacterium]|nr:GNAT family N-acetyltransferase [Thermomicrobiales bacterium]